MIQDFKLFLFLSIAGVGAASGLVYSDSTLYLVSDNASYIYLYDIKTETLKKELIFIVERGEMLENINKKTKPDFEAIAKHNDTLYIFASGTTPKRETLGVFDLTTKKTEIQNLSALYSKMRTAANLDANNLNIEGALYHKGSWLLFQRGNGTQQKNGLFVIEGLEVAKAEKISFYEISLPSINNVPYTFTDAVLVDKGIYFLATAENTVSAYEDGEVLGSLVGRLSADGYDVTYTRKISGTHKFEGLTLYKNTKVNIEFLLCEDRDSDELATAIYHLSISK